MPRYMPKGLMIIRFRIQKIKKLHISVNHMLANLSLSSTITTSKSAKCEVKDEFRVHWKKVNFPSSKILKIETPGTGLLIPPSKIERRDPSLGTPEDQAKVDRIFFLRVNSSAFAGLTDCTNNTQYEPTKACWDYMQIEWMPIINSFYNSPHEN